MKKWSVVFGVLAFISAAWAGPVLRWDGTETIPQFRRFDAAGKQDQAVPTAVRDAETGRFRYVFDGAACWRPPINSTERRLSGCR